MKLSDAKIEALRQRIANRGTVHLNYAMYRALYFDGWTRSQVDLAIEKLLATGAIAVEPAPSGVLVRWLEGEEADS